MFIWLAMLHCTDNTNRTHCGKDMVLMALRPEQNGHHIPDCNVHGANMGPIWGRQYPGGPHVGSMNLAIWDYYDFTWVSWHLKSLATLFFFQQLVQANNKEHFKCVYYWPFVRGIQSIHPSSLQWCHIEHDDISNHWGFDCLLNCWFRHRSKKTSKLHITSLCKGNPPVTSRFPSQRASNKEIFFIWWPRHDAGHYWYCQQNRQ